MAREFDPTPMRSFNPEPIRGKTLIPAEDDYPVGMRRQTKYGYVDPNPQGTPKSYIDNALDNLRGQASRAYESLPQQFQNIGGNIVENTNMFRESYMDAFQKSLGQQEMLRPFSETQSTTEPQGDAYTDYLGRQQRTQRPLVEEPFTYDYAQPQELTYDPASTRETLEEIDAKGKANKYAARDYKREVSGRTGQATPAELGTEEAPVLSNEKLSALKYGKDVTKALGRGALEIPKAIYGTAEIAAEELKRGRIPFVPTPSSLFVDPYYEKHSGGGVATPGISQFGEYAKVAKEEYTRLQGTDTLKPTDQYTKIMKGWAHPLAKSVLLAAESTPLMATAAITTALTGMPTLGAATFAPAILTGAYEDAKANGLTHSQAMNHALADTAVTTWLETIPLKGFLKGGKMPRRVVRGMLQEGLIEEGSQALSENTLRMIQWDTPKNFEDAMKKLSNGLMESIAAGTLMGGGMATIFTDEVINRLKKKGKLNDQAVIELQTMLQGAYDNVTMAAKQQILRNEVNKVMSNKEMMNKIVADNEKAQEQRFINDPVNTATEEAEQRGVSPQQVFMEKGLKQQQDGSVDVAFTPEDINEIQAEANRLPDKIKVSPKEAKALEPIIEEKLLDISEGQPVEEAVEEINTVNRLSNEVIKGNITKEQAIEQAENPELNQLNEMAKGSKTFDEFKKKLFALNERNPVLVGEMLDATGQSDSPTRFREIYENANKVVEAEQPLKSVGAASSLESSESQTLPDMPEKITVKDEAGNKRVIEPKEGEEFSITPFQAANGKVKYELHDGEDYIVSKNTAQNLANQYGVQVIPEGQFKTPEGVSEVVKEDKTNLRDKLYEDADAGRITIEQRNVGIDKLDVPNKTKYSQYNLAGDKKNYKEILITAPANEKLISERKALASIDRERPLTPTEQARYDELRKKTEVSSGGAFKSSHFEEPNILAHLRMNERTANGKKVSFIEEAQSDWAKAGREKGFDTKPEFPNELDIIKDASDKSAPYRIVYKDSKLGVPGAGRYTSKEQALEEWSNWPSSKGKEGVPFNKNLKNWQELSLKRAVREAVENNSEYLSWTTGQQQADRYDLSKQVDSIRYTKLDNGKYDIQALKGEDSLILKTNLSVEEVEGLIGKTPAEKIVSSDRKNGILKGQDLKIGGEWAVNLYDKQIPNILKKLTGGEIVKIPIFEGEDVKDYTQQALKITPQIREAVLGKKEKPVGADANKKATPLETEAKKYKSAEEFVEAQPIMYHQSQSKEPIIEFKQKNEKGYKKAYYSQAEEGIYFSPNKELVQSKYGKQGGQLVEVVLQPKKKLDLGDKDAMYFDGTKVNSGEITVENFKRQQRGEKELPEPDIELSTITKKAKNWLLKQGYDSVEGMKGEMWSAPETVVLDSSIIKTKAQLTAIWNKANKQGEAGFVSTEPITTEQLVDAIRRAKTDIKTALPQLQKLGEKVYSEGKTKFNDFRDTMKSKLGDMWNRFKSRIAKIYQGVKKAYKKSKISGQGGFVAFGKADVNQPRLDELKQKMREFEARYVEQQHRVDKLNLNEEEQAIIKDMQKVLGLDQRKVQTFEEIQMLANDLGTDPYNLLKSGYKNRISAEEVVALRDLISTNQKFVTENSPRLNTLANLKDTQALRVLENKITQAESQINSALAKLIKGGTEAGRTIAAYRLMARNSLEPAFWYSRALRIMNEGKGKVRGLTPEMMTAINELIEKKDVNGLAEFVSLLRDSALSEKAVSLWKAGLLTSPTTHMANIFGNTGMALMESLKDIPATGIDKLISLYTKQRTVTVSSKAIAAKVKAFKSGWTKGYSYFKTGVYPVDIMQKWDAKQTNFDNKLLQGYVDAIYRSLGAEDILFRELAMQESFVQQAILQAKNEKLKGEDYKERVKDLLEIPNNEMVLQAIEEAEYATYQSSNMMATGWSKLKQSARTNVDKRTGELTAGGQALATALEVMAPFVRTPSNIVMRTIDYSPVSVINSLYQIYKGVGEIRSDGKLSAYRQKRIAETIGRGLTGTAIPIGLGTLLASAGLAVGSPPEDKKERDMWYAEGKKRNSIKIGNYWISLDRFEPFGLLMGVGADLNKAYKEDELDEAWNIIGKTLKNITELPLLRGVLGGLKAVTTPERSFERFFIQAGVSLVPSAIGRLAKITDPQMKTISYKGWSGLKEKFFDRIPFMRKGLPQRYDVLGRPVTAASGKWAIIDPTRFTKATSSPVINEARRLGTAFGVPSKKLYGIDLTSKEYAGYTKFTGKTIDENLSKLISDPKYKSMNDIDKANMFDKVVSKVHREVNKVSFAIVMGKRYGVSKEHYQTLYDNRAAIKDDKFQKKSIKEQSELVKRKLQSINQDQKELQSQFK